MRPDGAALYERDEGADPGEPHHETVPPVSATIDSSRPTWQLVLALAWPVFAQQMLNVSVNLFDRYLVGTYRPDDVTYQAAQTTSQYLVWLLYNLSALVTVGATALVARFVGGRDRAHADRVLHQALLLAGAFGLLCTAIGLAALGPIVRLMGLHGPPADEAAAYLRPVLLLLTLQMVEQAGIGCLIGAGDTKTGLWVLGGVALLNMPLAWLFRDGLGAVGGIGFPGIALGTAVSHLLGGLAVLVVLLRGRAGLRLRPGALRPDRALLRRMLRISIPATVDVMSICLCQLYFLTLINSLGVVASAAHGIAIGWEALGYSSGQAFATAATTLVGQNLGAGRPAAAQRGGWEALGIGGGAMVVMGFVFYALAPAMFGLFCPAPEQAPVVALGVPVLRLVAFAMPALACIIVLTGALRGAGDTRLPLLLSLVGFLVIRMPAAYVLMYPSVDLGPLGVLPGAGLGLYGAWLAMFADLLVRGVCFLLRFAGGKWKTIRV